jgi:hypothetical protein
LEWGVVWIRGGTLGATGAGARRATRDDHHQRRRKRSENRIPEDNDGGRRGIDSAEWSIREPATASTPPLTTGVEQSSG